MSRMKNLTEEKWDFKAHYKYASMEPERIRKGGVLIPMPFAPGAIKPSYKKTVSLALEKARKSAKKPKGVVSWAAHMTFLTITVELAKLLFLYRRENRVITAGGIQKYANLLRFAPWSITGQPIIIDEDDRVIDGQHRLGGIIETGQPIVVLVVRGIPHENFRFMDNVMVRTAKHQLETYRDADGNPVDRPGDISSAATLAIRYALTRQGEYDKLGRYGIQHSFPSDVYKSNTQFSKWAALYRESRKEFSSIGLTPAVTICSMFYTFAADKRKADDFWEGVATGINLNKNSPVLALRNFLINEVVAVGEKPKSSQEKSFEAVVLAWNQYASGSKNRGKLEIHDRSEPFPLFRGAERAVTSVLKSIGE